MYQFQYHLTDNDYLEFSKYHLYNSPVNKKIMTVSRFMLPLMFALILLLSFINSDDFDITAFIGEFVFFSIVSVVWLFLLKPMYSRSLKNTAKRMKKHGGVPYCKDISLFFNEDSIVEITEKAETKTKYSSIEKISGGPFAIYIYFSSVQALIVPLSVFESERHRDEFWNFIQYKWNTEKSKLQV